MEEIRFHGRGGQGTVTISKILCIALFEDGKYSKSFPEFGVERRGAPVKAFLRASQAKIRSTYQIYEPDCVVILDPSLLKEKNILEGLKDNGWIIINSRKSPEELGFPKNFRVAVIDASSIAIKYGLGNKTEPIVNTVMAGAFSRITMLVQLESVFKAIREIEEIPEKKKENNMAAAQEAYNNVRIRTEKYTPARNDEQEQKQTKKEDIPDISVSFPSTGPKTGNWRSQKPVYAPKLSPCSNKCLAENNVQEWLNLLKTGQIYKAWLSLMKTNPLPFSCGKVCPAPCEDYCNRNQFDKSLSIKALEIFLGKQALKYGWKPNKTKVIFNNLKVAVIGSGPAGLSCAYQLAQKGYPVTIFETLQEAGGMLRMGIPNYRLPKKELKKEMTNNILSCPGIELKTDCLIGKEKLKAIQSEFSAVFVAIGNHQSKKLDIPGEETKGVMSGLEFLKTLNFSQIKENGKRIAVIGGGNTAIDAARSARRMGNIVCVIYRRTKEDMPAFKEEIEAAEKEGVTFYFLTRPIKIATERNGQKRIKCEQGFVENKEKDGRNNVSFRKNKYLDSELKVDKVIVAIGETTDETFAEYLKTKGIFWGGDAQNQAGRVASAIKSGRDASEKIHFYLTTGEEPKTENKKQKVAEFTSINLDYFKRQNRNNNIENAKTARKEAERCFGCGTCNLCGNCWEFCPDMSIIRKNGKCEIDYAYCKGCLICKTECPRGAIDLETEEEENILLERRK